MSPPSDAERSLVSLTDPVLFLIHRPHRHLQQHKYECVCGLMSLGVGGMCQLCRPSTCHVWPTVALHKRVDLQKRREDGGYRRKRGGSDVPER